MRSIVNWTKHHQFSWKSDSGDEVHALLHLFSFAIRNMQYMIFWDYFGTANYLRYQQRYRILTVFRITQSYRLQGLHHEYRDGR